jgi:type II restriction/modification system DNA methylase subunit YeeA
VRTLGVWPLILKESPSRRNSKPMPLSLLEFVERWKASTLSERAASQSHFIDLCEVLAQPHPAATDQSGDSFTFEKRVSTLEEGKGFADVWKRGFFGWEYKGKHKSLNAAYAQLVRYQGDLENPPLLVTCDQDRFEVHTNFTGTRPLVYSFTLEDLLTAAPSATCALPPLEVLRAVFTNPELLRPEAAQARVTEHAAAEFAKLADSLEQRGVDPERAAHFLMRLLFCLFADSIGLLPDHLFRQMIELDKSRAANFTRKLRQLFAAMSTSGSTFGPHDIHYFNGGLFADDEVFDLTTADMSVLRAAAALDWSQVEPAIFGTLFERSLNPGKRSQLGAHYTSREDILLIVEPAVIEPLQRRWEAVKAEATVLAEAAEKEAIAEGAAKRKGTAYPKLRKQLQGTLLNWLEELSKVRILDAACGSGNFLYLALRRLLDLWHEVRVFSAEHGLPTFLEKQVHPAQLFGLETNIYAQELASVVVWIGYLQWLNEHAIGWPTEPILRSLDNIQHRDAILAHDAEGKPTEPAWPQADFIIGNPPFLGSQKMRNMLGDTYVEELRGLYSERVPGTADLVTFWFERAREEIISGRTKRVGLLATNSIRDGGSNKVLQHITADCRIFMAWSDREWILDGAAVRVSIIGFEKKGTAEDGILDGKQVLRINPDLTSGLDLSSVPRLQENMNLSFQGPVKVGPFDIPQYTAQKMLASPNPHGKPNPDIVKPTINADDITGVTRNEWTIDFGEMKEADACLYEAPFEYVKTHVKPVRAKNKDEQRRKKWWRLGRSGGELKEARTGKERVILTPRVAKHRMFVWAPVDVVPDTRVYAFARDDDYFFGILHSRIHEVWTLATCSWHGVGNDPTYNNTTCFETFPFPWPPGHEPKDSLLVEAIAKAACQLVEKRDAWLNPPNASADDLETRTLTNLYNARPSWLVEAHSRLDEAVFAAYGWPATLTDAEVLEHLLTLNHERTAAGSDTGEAT